MAHKRGKRSTQERKLDLSPVNHEDRVSKRLLWVLNAEKVRKDYQERKKGKPMDRLHDGKSDQKRNNRRGDTFRSQEPVSQYQYSLRQDDQVNEEPPYRVERQKKNDIEQAQADAVPYYSHQGLRIERRTSATKGLSISHTTPSRSTEFERRTIRQSLNDIVKAPPLLTNFPRTNADSQESSGSPYGMEAERERAIAHYRANKHRRRWRKDIGEGNIDSN
ncbi:hypothetical protein FRC03_001608 [Tulasnella sp. 419]|nr:hypothetical protein FRC02_005236 [Tulasnella sp. 418]KAG8964578.1 hypothetical protein FRC03_001608 [Tulasnella sp. 419]